MKRLVLAALLAASCGDNSGATGDGNNGDTNPDGGGAATFTSFVIDLVNNHTADNTAPVDFATFSTLPDPDLNNPDPKIGGYSTLF